MYDIPKTVNLFWGGGTMSFMNMVTVLSFHEHNPDWSINVFTPSVLNNIARQWKTLEQSYSMRCIDYTDVVLSLPYVNRILIQNINTEYHPVIQADILRYYIMKDYGGIWSDFDIFYINPVGLFIDRNCDNNVFVSYSECDEKYHSVGFYIATRNNPFFVTLCDKLSEYECASNNYQRYGRDFVQKYFNTFEDIITLDKCDPYNLPERFVYPVKWNNTRPITHYDYNTVQNQLTKDTVGVHWFNGSNEVRYKIESVEHNHGSDKSMIGYCYEKYINR